MREPQEPVKPLSRLRPHSLRGLAPSADVKRIRPGASEWDIGGSLLWSEWGSEMWFHLPSTCCPSAPELPVQTMELDELSKMLERFATSSGKSHAAKYWLRACKTAPLMMRRSSLILHPSTASRGAALWMESLRQSHARATPLQAKEDWKKTRETSGLKLGESSAKWDRTTSCWKTSTASLFPEMDSPLPSFGYAESWPRTGTIRNGAFYRRPPLELPSDGSDCFSWPTAQVEYANGTAEDFLRRKREAVERGRSMGICLSDLNLTVPLWNWPAARSEDAEACGNHPQAMDSLTGTTQSWAAPMFADDGHKVTEASKIGLIPQAALWQAARASMAKNGNDAGSAQRQEQGPNPGLKTDASLWDAPTAHDGRRPGVDDKSTNGANLQWQVSQWAAAARDFRSEEASDNYTRAERTNRAASR